MSGLADLPRRSWLVPLSVVAALLLGFLAATLGVWQSDPSGVVQSTRTTPLSEQWDSYDVVLLFGAPFAALVAAAVPYFGLPRRRPWIYAIAGTGLAVGVMFLTGREAVRIGTWWLGYAPRGPVLAGGLLSLFVVPPTVMALLLASAASRVASEGGRAGPLLRFLFWGALLGIFVGGFATAQGASVAWATAGPGSWYAQHYALTSELFVATLLGAVEGLLLGCLCGFVAWLVRFREPSAPPAAA